MQLDIFELLEEPKRQAEAAALRDKHQREINQLHETIGMEDFNQIKTGRAISIAVDDLPWSKWELFPDYEECDVLVVVPPNAMSSLELMFRYPDKRRAYNDPVVKQLHDVWGQYNHLIWNYKPHGVDWCGASRLLQEHRDAGDPIWMRLIRGYGRLRFMPECVVEVRATK